MGYVQSDQSYVLDLDITDFWTELNIPIPTPPPPPPLPPVDFDSVPMEVSFG